MVSGILEDLNTKGLMDSGIVRSDSTGVIRALCRLRDSSYFLILCEGHLCQQHSWMTVTPTRAHRSRLSSLVSLSTSFNMAASMNAAAVNLRVHNAGARQLRRARNSARVARVRLHLRLLIILYHHT